jgi:hypothetical protein
MQRIGGETLIGCESCGCLIRVRRTDLRYTRLAAAARWTDPG